MAFQSKTEPASFTGFIPTTNKKEYCEMSISQLVSVLRIAFKIEDFDKIEQELVKREAKLRAEIGRLQEKIELERLQGIEFEERLKIREEQCERGKRAQEDYEQLLKEVKTNGWIEKHAIEELRRKNVALEREVCELKEFKKIVLDDVNSVDQLRDKIRVLKEEKVGDKNALHVLNMKNIEVKEEVKKNLTVIEGLRNENAKLTYEKVGNKNALDVLNMKNIELVEAVKKNLTVIEGLRNENAKLTDEKHELKTFIESLERRYSKLPVSYVKVEESTHCSVDTGNARSPKKGNKEDAVGALGVKFKLEKKIVDLSDDEDKYTSHGLHGEKAISQIIEENEYPQLVEIIKRKRASDIEASTSTSTSSTDLFEKENLPVKKTPLATPTPVTALVSSPSLSLSWQSRYLTSPPSPPSCHVKWKRARMTSSGQFTSESALQIAKRIDSLEMQSKQGMFHSDADFDGPSGRKKGPGETSQGDPTIDLSIVVSGRSDQPPRQEPTAHELVPILTKRLVLDGNPTYLRKLVDRGEIGYRRVGAGKALTARSFNVNVRYFRDSIKDVMTKVLTVRYENLGDMRPTDITAEITTYVPHIADICMTALYAKLRSINLAYGQHATRYTTAPSYTKDIELPLPLALAIQEFGSFQSHSLESNLIMIPTYPEGTQHEGRSAAAYPFAEYLTYVPTLARLGIPLKSVDAGVKTGSAWWTFKLEVIFGSADLICTLPRSHYSDMSAQLRMLFIAGDETHPPEDIVSLPATYNNFGTLASLITKQYDSRTFLAIIHGPKEEWDYGTV